MRKPKIEIFSDKNFLIDKKNLKKVINQVLNLVSNKFEQVAINFVNDEQLLEMNKRHLNHNYYTDILTFKFSDDPISTEIYISFERAFENSKKYNSTFEDEILRLISHGILHSIGLNDYSRSEKIKMRKAENHILNSIEKLQFIKKFKVNDKWQNM
ncbi:MAG: rRNA maturation RNase YbeY [Ignavibacteria bacterium]|nr:rRNA maturation RNase YbeY [Ignavibacteria bacterium]